MPEWRCAMIEMLFFLIGMVLGGLVAFVILWQIMNNWDVFVDYTWANRKKL